jgi:hypothetical protein
MPYFNKQRGTWMVQVVVNPALYQTPAPLPF